MHSKQMEWSEVLKDACRGGEQQKVKDGEEEAILGIT